VGDPATALPCINPNICHYQQPRPSSALTERQRGSFSIKNTAGGSQSTLNTICSSRKSQPNAFFNRLYNSDPNTNLIGEQSLVNDDSDYLSNYAHIKHSHRHPHYHLRRQSQPEPDDPRLMSRNSSSVKSFTSQCYNNPEYFSDIRPARSYDDSRASLISRKLSNQIMLLNSELHLLEQMRDHSQSYPKINYIEKEYEYLTDAAAPQYDFLKDAEAPQYDFLKDAATPQYEFLTDTVAPEQPERTSSSTPSESSDVSEFHENKTSTLERKAIPKPPFSETDSYSTINDEITQLVSKHFSNSIKQLVAQRFAEVESNYALPLRRRHSCGSSESYDDIIIPEMFNSPSRIKWNFLTGLPDRSRSHSQIGSSDYKTDFDDEDDDDDDDSQNGECKIDQILKRKSSSFDSKQPQQQHLNRDKTVSIWRTNSYGGARDDCNAIIFHHDSELVENCCENHFKTSDDCKKSSDGKDEDSTVYSFELCTKENCEYLSKSQVVLPQQPPHPDPLNNQTFPSTSTSNLSSSKNINLKHNKFKMKKKSKKKSTAKTTRDHEDFIMWSKLHLSHIMKKDSCNIDSVNLKPNSNSSSSNSINNVAGSNRRNLAKCYQKASNKLRQQPQGSLDITTLILASSASTQARLRSDGGIYFSNPDLSNIPADLRTVTNFTTNNNNNNNITSNNSCQFINNDLRNTSSSNINVNSRSLDRTHSRGRFNSATNYLESSINSNNIDNSNNSDIMQQQHLRGRLRYNQFTLNGIVRRAQRRARKYFTSLSFASRK
jgi:hypothetical protein